MSGSYRVILPGEGPLVEVFSFKNDPDFRDQWIPALEQKGLRLLSDRFWRFSQDPESKAARAVGIVAFGFMSQYPDEFNNIGTHATTGTYEADGTPVPSAYLALTAVKGSFKLRPERLVDTIIEATNEQLLDLNSPYQLPLRAPEQQA